MNRFKLFSLSLLVVLTFGFVKAQAIEPRRNAIHVGILRNTIDPFSDGTVTFERNWKPKLSVLASLGINPFLRDGKTTTFWQFYWHVSLELRYYFALRRNLQFSGFYFGIYTCYNHKTLYFGNSSQPYMRETVGSAGPKIGYQHAFGDRFRLGAGFATTIYPKLRTSVFNQNGQLIMQNVWPTNYTFYLFLRFGITI